MAGRPQHKGEEAKKEEGLMACQHGVWRCLGLPTGRRATG